MKKFIRFMTADGEAWDLPKEIPAKHRAEYYAKKDPEITLEEEFDFAMGDDYEAFDWLQNNMNREEYEPFLQHASKPRESTFMEKWDRDNGRGWDEVVK